jgi:hypothetical protein
LGKDARHGRSNSFEGKRAAHTGRSKEAFSINESSLGGKTESRRDTKSLCSKKRRPYSRRPKKAFGIDEGSVGSEKEILREIASGSQLTIEQLLVPCGKSFERRE